MKKLNLENIIKVWENTANKRIELYNAFFMMKEAGFIAPQTFKAFDKYIDEKARQALEG